MYFIYTSTYYLIKMSLKRRLYLQQRNRISCWRLQKKKNSQNLKKGSSETDQDKEDHYQNQFNFYIKLIQEKAVIILERINIFMNPYQFKYLAKVLLKITVNNDQDYFKFKSVLAFFQQVHSEQLFSPHFPPLLLNDPHNFEEKLHNCELLSKNNHFIKNLSLSYETQLRLDEVPFLLIKQSEFFKDTGDIENKLKGMICGLANHRGGYIIACQSFTKNRITQGLKEIPKVLIDNIKFKLETVLNTIVRKQDIGIEVQAKPLKEFDDKETEEEEYVTFIHVKINPQKSSNGFYIDRKKYNEMYKQKLQNNQKQKLISKYKKIISALHQQFPHLQINKLTEKIDDKSITSLIRLFCGQYESEWVCKEVREYEEMRKIMKFNLKKEASEDFKWKQKFTSGITINIKQIREKSMEKIQIKLHPNEDNHLRQICNYFLLRKQQSKKEIAQFFSQIPNQYSVGFIVRGQKVQMATINNILQKILKTTKTPYKIVVPFLELQKQIGKFRKQQTGAFQNYCYYVSFKGNFQDLYNEFNKQLDKNNIKSVAIDPVKLKIKLGGFLTSEDIKILQKTIFHFFNAKPDMTKVLNGKYEVTDEQYKIKLQQSPAFKSELQQQPFKYKQIQIYFKENKNELNASVFSYFLLFLARKRPKKIMY